MILSTIQPSFLPWLGYLEQMDAADLFVYLDDVKYTKQDWRNRNRLLNAAGAPEYVTVPVQAGADKLPIHEVRIADDRTWAKKTVNRMQAWYARAPHAAEHLPAIAGILGAGHGRLVDLNGALTDYLRAAYGIDTPIAHASDAGITTTDKNQRLIDLCLHHGADVLYDGAAAADFIDMDRFRAAGIEVVFQAYRPVPYDQGGHPFVSHLSALDTLLWCGPEAGAILRGSPLPAGLDRNGAAS